MRLERLVFSGEDVAFAAFDEQLEATLHVLKLEDCLGEELQLPAVKTKETAAKTAAKEQAGEEKKTQRFLIWCEFVQRL